MYVLYVLFIMTIYNAFNPFAVIIMSTSCLQILTLKWNILVKIFFGDLFSVQPPYRAHFWAESTSGQLKKIEKKKILVFDIFSIEICREMFKLKTESKAPSAESSAEGCILPS